MSETVLELCNLKVAFPTAHGLIRAVEGVDLSVGAGECLALVGESGCGKSVTSLAAMRLLDTSSAIVRADVHRICGTDVRKLTEREMTAVRGKQVSMIFQDALSALNPVMTVGRQLDEIFRLHLHVSKAQARQRSIEALATVGIPEPQLRYRAFPHELSGGMRQRVLIAMAFACDPKLIIADEPTTALDVTVQAQVLSLLRRLQKQHGTSVLLISHDLSVVAQMADRIAVMYSGKIVEQAPAKDLLHSPLHPYTKGLLSAVVRMDDTAQRFTQIPGTLPNPADKPSGCYFCPRCTAKMQRCETQTPRLRDVGDGHLVRCFFAGGDDDG